MHLIALAACLQVSPRRTSLGNLYKSDPEADTEESGDNFLSLGCRFLSFEGYTNCDCSGSHTLTAFLLYF